MSSLSPKHAKDPKNLVSLRGEMEYQSMDDETESNNEPTATEDVSLFW